MPDPDNFHIKDEDIKNFENCGDFVNGKFIDDVTQCGIFVVVDVIV